MSDKKFDLGDYVEVKDRIAKFYELFGQGRLVTGKVTLTSEPDGKPRVMVQALAYRSPEDTHPGVGYSWMELPGTTSYTKGSELENTETSAWGRAIASLGILTDHSIASAQEVGNKTADRHTPVAPLPRTTDGSLLGTVEVGKPPVDMEERPTPDGPAYGFKLKEGTKGYQVLAIGGLAEALSLAGLKAGDHVQCWGAMDMVPWKKDGKDMPPFARLALARIQTAEWTLPREEAQTAPLFTDDEAAEIAAREMAEATA